MIGFHPCGLVMDYVRRCRRVKMRTIQGAEPIEVVWFRVPPGTPMLEGVHPYGTRDWAQKHEHHGIGENEGPLCCYDKRPTVWYSGRPPAPYTGLDGFCGSANAARFGAVPGVDPVFESNVIGQGPCCAWPDDWIHIGAGGLAVGGDATLSGVGVVRGAGGLAAGGVGQLLGVGLVGGAPPGGGGVGGGAGFWLIDLVEGDGGLVVDGEGGPAGVVLLTGEGGLAVGGAGSLIGVGGLLGDGGLVVAGDGLLAGVGGLLGDGGLVVHGDAGPVGVGLVEGDGGLVVDGTGSPDGTEEEGGTCDPSDTFILDLDGVSGGDPWDFANGLYLLMWVSGSVWQAAGDPWLVTLTIELPEATLAFNAGEEAIVYICEDFDCAEGGTFFLFTSTGGSWPTPIEL